MKKLQKKIALDKKQKKKTFGFVSVILIVIGSSIGSGIFFKSGTVLSNSGGNLAFSIFTWVLSAFSVIVMALSLIEISSARKDNLSMIGWCKTFNKTYVYKACRNFMLYVYIPIDHFTMPLYVINSLQQALMGFGITNPNFGTNDDWAIWMVISLLLTTWFVFSSGLSSKMANVQNWVISAVKFIPLVAVVLLGFSVAGISGAQNTNLDATNWFNGSSLQFFSITPIFGLFGSMSAIFFAFDGFYTSAGIQSEMKEPRKLPKALVIGLLTTTAIYLVIAISMSIATSGGDFKTGFGDWLRMRNAGWVYGVLNILIAFGILGILNGYSLWAPRFIEDLVRENEIPILKRYYHKLNYGFPIVGTLYQFIISIPQIIMYSIIGGLAYFPAGYANSGFDLAGKEQTMASMLNFADLMATWTAVFAFAFIAFAIFGALINRKTNKVKTTKYKHFIWAGILAIILVDISLLFSIIQPIYDMGATINYVRLHGFDETVTYHNYVGDIALFAVLLIYIGISYLPWGITYSYQKIKNHKLQAVAAK